MAENVTLDEVYRLVEAVKDDHGVELRTIREQTVKTNGYVGRHEVRLDTLDREVRDLKRLIAAIAVAAPASVPVSTVEGESLSIKVSPKMWALIASAFAGLTIFAPMVSEWLKGLVKP